jgi:putative protease
MAKKRTKKAAKPKKVKKVKKPARKVSKKVKKLKKAVPTRKAKKSTKPGIPQIKGEKLVGRVEHFFDHISVAAISVKAPFKVGDNIHIKGHTTDFNQKIESLQIEHQSVMKVKKGDDVGIKVKEFVRQHDWVYLAPEQKSVTVKPPLATQAREPAEQKSQFVQTSIFEAGKPIKMPQVKTAAPVSQAVPNKQEQGSQYTDKKFFQF